jgi:hypothetical protein
MKGCVFPRHPVRKMNRKFCISTTWFVYLFVGDRFGLSLLDQDSLAHCPNAAAATGLIGSRKSLVSLFSSTPE